LELLWNKYWVQTLAQNPLLTNRDYGTAQMKDLNRRVWEAGQAIGRNATMGRLNDVGTSAKGSNSASVVDRSMDKIVREIDQVAKKERARLMATEIKVALFGGEEKKT
jgi:COP9 signalosome complex subunit 5